MIFLIVSNEHYQSKSGGTVYKAVCTKCGFEYKARIQSIKGANLTKNCNHLKFDYELAEYEKNYDVPNSLKYIFKNMKTRCNNENNKSYRFYGAKEICICDDWANHPAHFYDWALNNGYIEGLTIDRIDSSKDYMPDNCRWITLEENSRWKSTTNQITINGICHSGRQWSTIIGKGVNFVNTHIRKYGLVDTIELIKKELKTNY